MKLAIIGMVIWSGKRLAGASKFTFVPSESGRLATKNFKSELAAVTRRNWYYPDVRRQYYAEVFQFGRRKPYLFLNHGYDLSLGGMNQVKFSLIRETKDCTVGFMHSRYFIRYSDVDEDALGFDLRKGNLAGGDKLRFVYDEVGKESDDIDWFIEYYDDEHVEIYMTLNGEPLGMVYKMASLSKENAARIRPSLRCSVYEYTDSANVVAVTQYSSIKIPVVRPYAAQRKPDGKNFELELEFTEYTKRMFGLDYRLALHLKINGPKMEAAGVIERHRCNKSMHRYYVDPRLEGPLETLCQPLDRNLMRTHSDFKREIIKSFDDWLDTRVYERLPNGNVKLHSLSIRNYNNITFYPLHYDAVTPVDIDPFTIKVLQALLLRKLDLDERPTLPPFLTR